MMRPLLVAALVLAGCSSGGDDASQEDALRDMLKERLDADPAGIDEVCGGLALMGEDGMVDVLVREFDQGRDADDDPEGEAVRAFVDDLGSERVAEITVDVMADRCASR